MAPYNRQFETAGASVPAMQGVVGIIGMPYEDWEELSQQINTLKGKTSFSYLPKPPKKKADEILDQMERLPIVVKCYQKWWELQCRVNDSYSEQERHRPPVYLMLL